MPQTQAPFCPSLPRPPPKANNCYSCAWINYLGELHCHSQGIPKLWTYLSSLIPSTFFAFKYFDFCSLRLNIPTTFSSLEKYLLYVSVTPAAGLRCSFPSSWRDNYIVFLMTPLVSGSFSLYCRIYALTTEIVLHPSACYTRKMITILLGLNLASKSLTICITHQLWFPPSHKFHNLATKGFPHFFAWWLHAVCPRWQLSSRGPSLTSHTKVVSQSLFVMSSWFNYMHNTHNRIFVFVQ